MCNYLRLFKSLACVKNCTACNKNNCENCSYHNGEVMVGGAVSPHARKITCKVDSAKDLERELLKSETAAIRIPECDFDMQPGTLGGKFTTVEGILKDIKQNLSDKYHSTRKVFT